ncbi:MAG: hypothetical protein SGPRY_010484 [Prymnesium sp.]
MELECSYTTRVSSEAVAVQRMLHLLLVDGRRAGTNTYESLYILPNGTSPHMSMVKPEDDTYWDSSSSQYVYISQISRAWDGAKGGRIVGYNLQTQHFLVLPVAIATAVWLFT